MNEVELRRIIRDADVSQELLNKLGPFFALLRENIHKKWEELHLDDGPNAKLLKFQLRTVIQLEEAMAKKTKEGRLAKDRLETN